MTESLITLNLDENILRIVKARNLQGKIDMELHYCLQGTPPFFESDTQKINDDVASQIKKSIDNLKLSKRKMNIVIPDGFTYSQIVYMPKLKEKELLSAIKYQADQFIPMPIEETSLDLDILHEDKTTNKLLVLIIAAPQKLIERVQDLTERAGFFPETIENELSATGRFLANFYSPPAGEGGTIFINLGYSSTSFYLFDHKLRLITDTHNFRAGFSVFLREAQADVNIDITKAKNLLKKIGFAKDPTIDFNQILQPTIDAISTELKKFIISVKTKSPSLSIGRLYLTNLATELNLIDKKIEAAVSFPSAIYNPQTLVIKKNPTEPPIIDFPSYIPAIGGCLE